MKRSFKGGLSAYEREQTKRALEWKPINLSERQRAGHRKLESDMVREALQKTAVRQALRAAIKSTKESANG